MPSDYLVAAPHHLSPMPGGALRIYRLDDASYEDYPPLFGALLQIAAFAAPAEMLQLRLAERTGCAPATALATLERALQDELLCDAFRSSPRLEYPPVGPGSCLGSCPRFDNEALLDPQHDLLLVGPAPVCEGPGTLLRQAGLISEYPPAGTAHRPRSTDNLLHWRQWLRDPQAAPAITPASIHARRDFLAARHWPPQWLGIHWIDQAPYPDRWIATGIEHWQGQGLLDNRLLLPPAYPYFVSAYGAILASLFPSRYLLHVPADLEPGRGSRNEASEQLAQLAIRSLEASSPTGEIELRYRMLSRHLRALSDSPDQRVVIALTGCHYRKQLALDRWQEIYSVDVTVCESDEPPVWNPQQIGELRAAAREYAELLASWPQRWHQARKAPGKP